MGGGFKHHGKVVWPGFSEVTQRHVAKVGRNDPCPCGSGKKYKECHEEDGEVFLEKLARQRDRERLAEQRVPWYKRFFFS